MPSLCKVFVLLTLYAVSTEGKTKKNEALIPIEVVLNPNNNHGKVPESTRLIKNKAIELEIHSDDRQQGGKVDLIIAATKEVQATERNVDRYSPAFNSENDLLSGSGTPGGFKSSGLKFGGGDWDASSDTSRQDPFYPAQDADLFPFLMLRQVLRTPQPLLLERQNQFSPLQNLRSFEDNLQRELLPYHRSNQELGPPPVRVVMSQPIYTGNSPANNNQQGQLLNSPQVLNLLQSGLLPPARQQHGLHIQQRNPNLHQHLSPFQNPPVNRYPLVNGSPEGTLSLGNQNNVHLSSNDLSNNGLQNPFQNYGEPQRQAHQPSPNEPLRIPQALPGILGPNGQPLPIHGRPQYTLERNLNALPIRERPYGQNVVTPHQSQNLNQLNPGIRNYPQNQEYALIPYNSFANGRPQQNSYGFNRQQPSIQQRQPFTVNHPTAKDLNLNSQQHLNLNPNNRQYLHHLPNVSPTAGHNKVDPLPPPPLDRYRAPPAPREYRTSNVEIPRPIQSNHQLSAHQEVPPQSNYGRDPTLLRSGPATSKLPEDERKVPVYRHPPPERTRQPYYQNLPSSSSSEADYSRKHSDDVSLQQNVPANGHRQLYHESPSYSSQPRNTDIDSTDSSDHSGEISQPERNKYNSSTPTKRRRLRTRKRNQDKQQDNTEDLEGHSSHQYIIKIG